MSAVQWGRRIAPSESVIMLAGRTVLIVETEFIIALGIQAVVEHLNARSVVVASSVADALDKVAHWSHAGLAIIELESNRPELIEFARQLSQGGIPVLGLSADTRLAFGVPELPGTPILIKPIPDEELAAAVARRLGQNPLPEVT